MTILYAFALAQAIAAPVPDAAACALEGIGAQPLADTRTALLARVVSGTPLPAAVEATLKTVETNGAACSNARTPAAKAAAGKRAAVALTADTFAQRLSLEGVDMAKVDAAIAATPAAVVDAFNARRFTAPGVDAFGDRVIGVAGPDASAEVRKLLGAYAVNKVKLTRPAAPAGPR